jgi:hypothetical protein
MELLVKAGAWVNEQGGSATGHEGSKPNSQFCGWGLVGKKTSEEEEQQEKRNQKWEFGWTEPVVIPYFDLGDGRGLSSWFR